MMKFSRTAMFLTLVGLAGLAAAGDPKADPKAAPKGEAKKPEAPKPPQEIADMMKAMGGTWKCEGKFKSPDGKEIPYKSTVKPKTELAGFYIHETVDIKGTDAKMPMNFMIEAYMTYEPAAKKWRRVEVMSDGGMAMGTSDGMKDNKLEMMMDTFGPHPGQMKVSIDATDLKKGMHMVGQMSMDKGKTWNQMIDETCKK